MANKCPKCETNNPDTLKFCGECGTQLPSIKDIEVTETLETPKEELSTGSTFAGRYQIIEELGKGGMGKVYKVHDTRIKEKIALKLIKPEIAKDKKTIERFSNELKFARKIRHKNICQMFDLGEDRGTHFITMEFVEGQDLKKLIRQSGQLAIGTTINIAKQVCDGLIEAHSSGVIHRDLKPSNIMIDADGNARIMDFGIARSIEGKGITGTGMMIGTPEYMSPEQVEGKDVGQRSDIYSLGVILYEMVTGRVPFEGDTPLSVAVKHKTEAPLDPTQINTQIPEDLSQLILRCMEKDKEKRHQSVGEVRSELENIEKGIPTTERIVPKRKSITSKEITVQLSMKKIFIPVFIVITMAFIGLFLWSPWSKKSATLIPSDKPSLVVMYFENDTGSENLDIWREGLADLIIDDLSQSRLLKVLRGDRLYFILQKENLLEVKNYSSEDLKNVARQAGYRYILRGSFNKAGEIIRITTRLQDIDAEESLGIQRIDCKGEEGFFAAVDELTRKIKTDLNLNSQEVASEIDWEVGATTTNSPEAYKYYSEGRKYHLRQDYEQSVPFMERAIKIDSSFAMAYRSLAAGPIPQKEKLEYIQKAYDLSDRVTETERLLIHGDYHKYNRNFDKSIEAYNELIELVPDHGGLDNLARLYQDLGEWDKAIELFEKRRKIGATWRGTYTFLGDLYEAKGMYEKAREVYEDCINNFQEDAIMHVLIAHAYYYEGNYDEAIVETDKALTMNPNSDSKARIYHLRGDFEAAEKEYKSWLEKEETDWKMNGRRSLEILYRTLGQYEKAKKEAQAGLEYAEENNFIGWIRIFHNLLAGHDLSGGYLISVLERAEFIWDSAVEVENTGWQINALWWKIQVHLKQDNIREALVLAEEVKKIADSTPNRRNIRWYLDDLGLIEMKRENYSKAIDLFTQVYELEGGQRTWFEAHAYILYNLASAYYLSGDFDAARQEYENILALTTGRVSSGDLYVKSYYMLGKIHEQQGNTPQAIENYEIFLDLWKDADPGISEVDDARKKLAELKGH